MSRDAVIRITNNELKVILETFRYMYAHFYDEEADIFDHASLMMTKEDLEGALDKLKPFEHNSDEIVAIPMNFDEWTIFYGFIMNASNKVPQSSSQNLEVLDDIMGSYGDKFDGLF